MPFQPGALSASRRGRRGPLRPPAKGLRRVGGPGSSSWRLPSPSSSCSFLGSEARGQAGGSLQRILGKPTYTPPSATLGNTAEAGQRGLSVLPALSQDWTVSLRSRKPRLTAERALPKVKQKEVDAGIQLSSHWPCCPHPHTSRPQGLENNVSRIKSFMFSINAIECLCVSAIAGTGVVREQNRQPARMEEDELLSKPILYHGRR